MTEKSKTVYVCDYCKKEHENAENCGKCEGYCFKKKVERKSREEEIRQELAQILPQHYSKFLVNVV